MASGQSFSDWRRQHPNQIGVIAVAALILAGSVGIGMQARSGTAEIAKAKLGWQRTSDQMATVRQQFRVPSSSESGALLSESARMGALGVPPGERVTLIELVARLAEASALADVHVTFRTATDSTFVPARMIGGTAVSPAAYAIGVDFTGSFAGLVQFVSNLPPSVSVSRLGAAQRGDRVAYHLLLAVYELPNGDNAS